MEKIYKNRRNNKCFVPNCTSGYKSNKEKISMFSVPKNTDLRNEWEQNIQRMDRQLKPVDKVCEKHFTEESIIRFMEFGQTKCKYERPRLKKDAIPTIFPSCQSTSKNASKKKKTSLLFDHIYIKTEKLSEENIDFEMPSISGPAENNATKRQLNNVTEEIVEETSTSTEINLFCNVENTNTQSVNNLIFLSITQENLAPLNWGFHFTNNEDGRSVILTKLKLLHSGPIIHKSLIIKEDLSCSIYYLKHKMHDSIISSLSHIKDVLRSMEEQHVCEGGPDTTLYDPKSRNSTVAIIDQDLNCWRHRKCKIICGNQLRCDNCTNLLHLFTK